MGKKSWELGTNYIEDSTVGKSVLNPITYKRDVFVQVWIQSRYLAILDQWLEDGGIRNKYMAGIVNKTIEQVINSLMESGEIKNLLTCQGARDYLEFKFNTKLNIANRGKKNILHNLHLDSRNSRNQDVSVNYKPAISDEEWERIQERIKEEDEKERINQKKKIGEKLDKLLKDNNGGIIEE